jgi:hypothetical protein
MHRKNSRIELLKKKIDTDIKDYEALRDAATVQVVQHQYDGMVCALRTLRYKVVDIETMSIENVRKELSQLNK